MAKGRNEEPNPTMAKGRNEEEPSPELPRNTITLSLDGTEDQVLANFQASQAYFRFWNFCRTKYRVKVGNKMIYTCPLDGTFYYLVRYEEKFVVFVIVSRQYWLLGIWNSYGFFQSIWEDNRKFYMDSNKTISIGFGLNHNDIGDGGVDRTRMGIWALREGLVALSSYRGPDRPEPPGFREAWGRFIIFIMETKFHEILRRCCDSMGGFGRLGIGAQNLIVQWRSLCKIVMEGIENGFDNQERLDNANDLLGTILIYHVDAWAKGNIFFHPSLPPKPRDEVWAPIDQGDGDGDIQNPDVVAPRSLPRSHHVTYTKGRGGRKRGSIQVEDKDGKRARRACTGLRGGGVGGSAVDLVPDWFLSWHQHIGDEKALNDLITFAKEELGLKFVEAPALHLKQDVEKKIQTLQLSTALKQLPESDIKDIRGGDFICDEVIRQHFQRLDSTLDKRVNLVPPAASMAFSHDPDAMDAAVLASSQLTIFPVNNSTSPEPDKGSHWSVMVLYSPDDGSPPRLVHHDSTLGRINSAAAERLARSIRHVLPALQGRDVEHANTPIQQNGVDCAVFLMAIANSIGRWWLRRGLQGQQPQQHGQSWMNTLMRDVNQERVTLMRDLLTDFLLGHITVNELNSRCFGGEGDDDCSTAD